MQIWRKTRPRKIRPLWLKTLEKTSYLILKSKIHYSGGSAPCTPAPAEGYVSLRSLRPHPILRHVFASVFASNLRYTFYKYQSSYLKFRGIQLYYTVWPCMGRIFLGANFPGANFPQGRIFRGEFSRGEFSCFRFDWPNRVQRLIQIIRLIPIV